MWVSEKGRGLQSLKNMGYDRNAPTLAQQFLSRSERQFFNLGVCLHWRKGGMMKSLIFFIELKELNRSSNLNFLNAEKFLKYKKISLINKNGLSSKFSSSFFVAKHFWTCLNHLPPSLPFPSIKGIQKGTNLGTVFEFGDVFCFTDFLRGFFI